MNSPVPDDFPIWDFDRTLLSEKTFKMIACGIPTFCIDTRYTSEHFKELGFNLLDTMIYYKQNYAPAYPALRRYANQFEYMFIFSR